MKIYEFGAHAAFSCALLESWSNWLIQSTPCVGQGGDSVDVNCCEKRRSLLSDLPGKCCKLTVMFEQCSSEEKV